MDRIERAAENAEPARRAHASCRSRAGVIRSIPSSAGSGSGSAARPHARRRCRARRSRAVRRGRRHSPPRSSRTAAASSARDGAGGRAGRDRRARRSWSRRRSAASPRRLVESTQLVADRVEVLDRVAAGRARDVDEVHEDLRALDVPQELMPETVALVRALDQAGHVGDDEAAVAAERDDAEVRRQRRERIVGDLRTGRRDPRDQRGLARRWESRRGRRRRAASARRRSCFSSPSSPGSVRRGARFVDETNRALPRPPRPPCATSTRCPSSARSASRRCLVAVLLEDQRADGDRDLEILRRLTGPVRALTVLTAAGLELGVVAEVDERVLGGDGGDVDRATVAAVAAVRSAARDVLLAPETEAAVAAGTGGHVDVDFVDEHIRIQESGVRIQNSA